MKYLGIDLGTANTYIYGTDGGQSVPAPVVIPGASDDNGSIATVVMYEDGQPALAGNIAEAEFYSQPGLQSKRRLASQFKPEIGIGDEAALKACADFLRILRTSMPAGVLETNTEITVGVPALAREDFRLRLQACFNESGWPAPAFCRESDAALVSCLQAGALHVNDIGRKSLILDFGGGTCDYTSIASLDVLQNGGDILYGGRLFDDLFYQAFCRANPDFARECPVSPYSWYAHWIECRIQKERFSDAIASGNANPPGLRIVWHTAAGQSREAFLTGYSNEDFLRDAENFRASPELLAMLAPYSDRGGLSGHARDLLAGRTVGLLSWLRAILESVQDRRGVAKVILTGGSSRWHYVHEYARDIFPAATLVPSSRGYEDIAFGLALFPLLSASQARAQVLLNEQIGSFSERAERLATELVDTQARKIAALCSERIVSRDVMPILEAAQNEGLTAAELEARFAQSIRSDTFLVKIVEENSETLRAEIQEQLNFAFRGWLRENGVPLAPSFDFPAAAIGQDFFRDISVKISRLDSLNLMTFTLQKILPLVVATATATTLAHTGEPVSTVIGGGAAFGTTWALAKVAPAFLASRKLPAFVLNEKNRKKIAARNQEHIEKTLLESFAEIRKRLASDIELKIRDSLSATLAGLSALNQVRMH